MSDLSPSSRAFIEKNNVTNFQCSEPWLIKLRKNGLESFAAQGFPTSVLEEWKYTNLDIFETLDSQNDNVNTVTINDLIWLPSSLKTHRMVFVNGEFNPELSSANLIDAGIKVMPLSDVLATDSIIIQDYLGQIGSFNEFPICALNTAFIEDGIVIYIEGRQLTEPIEVLFVSAGGDNAAYHPRNLVVAKNSAQLTMLERHVGIESGAYLANSVYEILVDNDSHVRHYRMLDDSSEAINLSMVKARVGHDSSYDSFVMSAGGHLSRVEIHVDCISSGARTNLNGVYIARTSQHMDHTTCIKHLVPNTTSSENYKGVLDGNSRGVFQGSIIVSEGADGTDGRMNNKTLLLSDGCEIDAKPQLEIYADDVQCAHGFTAGELDDDSLFYLCSRGIPLPMARSMLVEGFLAEVIDAAVIDPHQVVFKDKITEWMGETYDRI